MTYGVGERLLPKKEDKVLEDKDKRYNKKLSRARVVVEYVIRRMRKFKVMGSEFRNKLGGYDDMTLIGVNPILIRIMRKEGNLQMTIA